MTLTAAGLAVVGLTATSEGPQRYSLAALMAVESAILAPGVGLVRIATHRDVKHLGEALLLATAAGVLFGVSDVAIKYPHSLATLHAGGGKGAHGRVRHRCRSSHNQTSVRPSKRGGYTRRLMTDANLTDPEKVILKGLLDKHPEPVAVKNLADDPDDWPKTWDIVQRLADEQVPLVELGQSGGDDRSNVPVTLTPAGETTARTL